MKSKNYLGSIVAVLAAICVFVWVAMAQDQTTSSCCSASGTAGVVDKAADACPVTGVCPGKGLGLAGVAVYLDSPAALLAKASILALTAEQQDEIEAIQVSARAQALGTLTDIQKVVLGDIPVEPLVLGDLVPKACCAEAKACESDCTKPCCAETKAVSAQQTLCPVMNSRINKALFIKYRGKKVYFCCPGCEGAFNKAPEEYLSKLPQFNI